MSNRPCPICSTTASTPWKQKGSLTIVTCQTCGLKYVRDTTIIPPDYYEHEGDSFYVSQEKLKGDHNPERYRREVNFFTKHCPTGSILDVGCSTGGFLLSLNKARPNQYQLYGTDVAPEARNIARSHGLNILEGDFTAATLPNAPFDAITFWAVLEHLTDPQKQITSAHKMLKPGGLLFAVVPNVDSLATRLLGARYRYILPEHLNYYSTKTLAQLLKNKNNFEPIEIKTSHFNPIVILQDALRRTDPTRTQRAELLTKTNRLKQTSARPIKAAYQLLESTLNHFKLADNIMAAFQKIS